MAYKSAWNYKVFFIIIIIYFRQYLIYFRIMPNMKMKLARVEKNLSQQQLAERVGVTRQTIGLIEKGKYNPTLKLCLKIAHTLDRSIDQLFWETNHD